MSLLAAFFLLAAQAEEPQPYRALGASPLWQASIYGDAMSFETPGRDRMYVERPTRQETELGFVYRSSDLAISVEHRDCTDRLSGLGYADQVTITVGTMQYTGCGGPARARGRVAPYGAAGSEPFWSLEIADGRLYFGVNDDVVMVPTPRAIVTGNGRIRRYTAPGISVLLKRENCELEDERTYADTVTVIAGHWRVEGCGGRVLREAPGD
jgi:uncharacterized membrane protein